MTILVSGQDLAVELTLLAIRCAAACAPAASPPPKPVAREISKVFEGGKGERLWPQGRFANHP